MIRTSPLPILADLRAPTPTAAAELATPDGPEWLRKLSRMEQALHASARHSLLRSKLKLDVYLRGKLLDAYSLLSPYSQRLDDMEENSAECRNHENFFHNALHINKLEHQLQMRHPPEPGAHTASGFPSGRFIPCCRRPHDGFIFTTHSYSSTS